MVSQDIIRNESTAPTTVRDDAVGVANPQKSIPVDSTKNAVWYVAIVRHNTETKVCDFLEAQGISCFTASQLRLRVTPSGRRKWVSRILIPAKIFIYCTEKERLEIVNHPFIYRFLTDPSQRNAGGNRKVAVIPQNEIETLRFMLGQKDYPVSFTEHNYQKGSLIKIVRGALKGLEGIVIESANNQQEIGVKLDFLGCARVTIPAVDIEPLTK